MPGRILVIDDNEEMLDLFCALLDDQAYEVIGSDFIDANRIVQLAPDLLILDYLEGMQPVGGRIVAALKQHPATMHLPVIICTTASVARTSQDTALNAAGVSVVYKPFDVIELLQAIEDGLGRASPVSTRHC